VKTGAGYDMKEVGWTGIHGFAAEPSAGVYLREARWVTTGSGSR
jgi:hypothetical protein